MIGTLKRTIGFNPLAWLRQTRRMRQLVRAFDGPPPPAPGAPRFAVVVTPWLGTTVPWFSLATGLMLARNGSPVTFLIDDLPFGRNRPRYVFVLRCIHSVFRALGNRHEVVVLSTLRKRTPLGPTVRATVERLARLNAVWEMRGEMAEAGRADYIARCSEQLSAAYGPIAAALRPDAFDALFIPGGIWGNTGIWSEHARATGIRIASYDTGGYGTVMIASDGIACQLQDIPAAFARLKQRSGEAGERQFAVESALAEMARRRAGVDTFASQIEGGSSGDARYDGAILLALNSSWDSAALGLHTVFEDNRQWIVETTRYLLEHSTAPVIVRQHPAERLAIASTSDDYLALLKRHFGTHPRLHFIAADEKINSYALLERVAAVVVYTSTIGIEAAAHGKPVITPSSSYYAGLGFVWQATDLAQYQAQLSRAVSRKLEVTPSMRDDAHLCYYLTQCCNWVFSPFNPSGFAEWSRLGLAQLQADPKVQTVLKSLQHNIPVAYLNHLEGLARSGAGATRATA